MDSSTRKQVLAAIRNSTLLQSPVNGLQEKEHIKENLSIVKDLTGGTVIFGTSCPHCDKGDLIEHLCGSVFECPYCGATFSEEDLPDESGPLVHQRVNLKIDIEFEYTGKDRLEEKGLEGLKWDLYNSLSALFKDPGMYAASLLNLYIKSKIQDPVEK